MSYSSPRVCFLPGCASTGSCYCRPRSAFYSAPLPPVTPKCNSGAPALTVEAWSGYPGATGSTGTAVGLDFCDTIKFWSEGTMNFDLFPGSVHVDMKSSTMLSGSQDPVSPPPAPDYGWQYTNTTSHQLFQWIPGSSGVWQQAFPGQEGSTGTTGPQGVTGQQGATGPDGSTGAPGSARIGLLAVGSTGYGAGWLKADGQVLTSASYPDMANQVGRMPDFTANLSTMLPTSVVDIAYASSGGASGMYVAVGGNQVFLSRDTTNWNRIPVSDDKFASSPTSITFSTGLGMFVLVNGTTIAYTSTDGLTWIPSLTYADAVLNFVAASPTTVVAVGPSDVNASFNNKFQNVWYTTTAASGGWTPTPLGSTGAGDCTAITWANNQFVLGTSTGVIQTSPDGITWTLRTSNSATSIAQIAYDGIGTWLSANSGGVTRSIDNAATWSRVYTQTAFSGIVYTPFGWIAVAVDAIATSVTGLSGTWGTLATNIANGVSRPISYGAGQYVQAGGGKPLLATSPDLITWTSRVNSLPNIITNANAYGNGQYVFVGFTGMIQSSPDGINWTPRVSGMGNQAIRDVIYAEQGIFVAISGSTATLTTSVDGINWTTRTNAISSFGIASNASSIVTVGGGGISTSIDSGTTWLPQTQLANQTLISVAWNGSQYCAVGNANTIILGTTGGTEWTKIIPNGFGLGFITQITADNTYFYAYQNGTTLFISQDGINWIGYATPFVFGGIIWINNRLIAMSATNDLAWSTDGRTWTNSPNNRFIKTNAFTKAYNINGQILIGNTYSGVTRTTDGVFFSGQASNRFNAVVYSSSQTKFVACGNSGCIMYSIDNGVTWTQVMQLAGSEAVNFTSITYSPSLDLFVIVSNNGGVWTSTSGSSWTQRVFTNRYMGNVISTAFNNIIWSAERSLFVAVGTAGTIATSSDGITWTDRNNGPITQYGTFVQVCYNAILDMFVVCGSFGIAGTLSTAPLMRSTDGINWTIIPSSNTGGGVGDYGFVSVSSLEENGFLVLANTNVALYSTDGITWKQKFLDATLAPTSATTGLYAKMAYSAVDKGAFYFNGDSSSSSTSIFVYTDGLNYYMASPVYNGLSVFQPLGMAYNPTDDVWVAIGSAGMCVRLVRSYDPATQFVLPTYSNQFIKVL